MSIKNELKKNEDILYYYKQIRLLINSYKYKKSQKRFTEEVFYKNLKYSLDLEDPKTFNEKIQWLKFNKMSEEYIRCADKYELRNYVSDYFPEYESNFPRLLSVYKDSSEIDLNKLPDKFVLKCNHGCGFNYICTNKKNINLKSIKKKVNRWMNTNYEYVACESQYHFMKKVIYAEEFITSFNSDVPIDYKLFCFSGKVKMIMVCLDRIGDHASEYHYFDLQWTPLLIDKKTDIEKTKLIEKPLNFSKMIEIAENLSAPFKFVRIDFYDTKTKPIIGEMTFTPGGGVDMDYDYETDLMLGSWIELND